MATNVSIPKPAEAITGAGFTATASASTTPPAAATTGALVDGFNYVRTIFTFSGTVTAANVRLWTRNSGSGTAWKRGASTNDLAPLTPSTLIASPDDSKFYDSRNWWIGAGTEVKFTLESITQSTGTVAVDAIGVAS